MADITMCTHEGCKQAMSCYRKRAIPSNYQSMADLYEIHPSDPSIKCVSFWPLEGRNNITPLIPEFCS